MFCHHYDNQFTNTKHSKKSTKLIVFFFNDRPSQQNKDPKVPQNEKCLQKNRNKTNVISIQSHPNGIFLKIKKGRKKEPPCFYISSGQVTLSDTKICRCERRKDIELW